MTAGPLRWSVIGTGRISDSFVPDLRQASASVTAVWGRRTETVNDFAARHGIPFATTDLGVAVGSSEVDVVYIATPPATHYDLALRALDAGKHVLVEKPMTMSHEDSKQLFARAAAKGRFVAEAMWMKFNPLHRDVMGRIAEGVIGTPSYVRAGFGMPFPPGGSRWDVALGGSSVLDQGIYPVTLAQWALGDVVSVFASGRVRDEVDIAAEVSLRHEAGGISHFACSIVDFVDSSASVSGSRGWVEIPAMFWAGELALEHAGTRQALFEEPTRISHTREGNGYVPMIRAVGEAIRAGARTHPWHDEVSTLAVARVLGDIREQVLSVRGQR